MRRCCSGVGAVDRLLLRKGELGGGGVTFGFSFIQ